MLPLLLSLSLLAADPPSPAPAPPAAKLSIVGLAEVKEHRMGDLAAAGVPEGAALIWDVSDEESVDLRENADGTVTFTAPPGTYTVKLRAITFGPKRATQTARLTVTVRAQETRPPPVDPVKPPAKPIVTGSLYFVVVRPDGPASPAFTAAMGLPEWDELRKAGHSVKDYAVAASAAILRPEDLPPGTTLPCAFVLRSRPEGSVILKGPLPLPSSGAAVLELLKGL